MPRDKKKKKTSSGEGFSIGDNEGLNVPLGALFGNVPRRTEEGDPAPQAAAAAPAGNLLESIKRSGKIVLQRQTAGRGGKTVTAVMISKDTPIDMEALAKEMRKGLGCGSRVEEGKIILQGDICDRAGEWLLKKGARRVISGN